jgi:hypothetical protein
MLGKAVVTSKGARAQVKEIKDRYNRFILDWTEATGGEFTGEAVDLKTVMDDIFFIVYGYFPADLAGHGSAEIAAPAQQVLF